MSSRLAWRGVIEEYAELLPVSDQTPRVTLLEGATPLIPSEHIGPGLPGRLSLFFKYEGLNPTGSFKDRGMTVAVSKALEEGAQATICASTGNTAASAAAYSSRAGLRCAVLIPYGYVALGKLAGAIRYGATTLCLEGNFDDCLRIVRAVVERYPIAFVNSLNPYRMDGQKTAAFEICDVLGQPPDYHALPVGNAGNISANWWGYEHYHRAGRIARLPKMLGFQAEGAAPIYHGKPVAQPQTKASAIRIGNPARWQDAQAALDNSGGHIDIVTEDEIRAAYEDLAACEGIFAEPASAASVAGVRKLAQRGFFGSEPTTVVCTITGHGLKDPDYAMEGTWPGEPLPPEEETVVEHLGLQATVEVT